MKTSKMIMAAIAGGIVAFLLGWLVYGVLMADFFAGNMGSATGVMRGEEEMDFVGLSLGNLAWGLLTAVVLNWAGKTSFSSGLSGGAILGLLVSLSFNLISVGTSHIMNYTGALADVGVSTVMNGLIGGVVGAILGRGNK